MFNLLNPLRICNHGIVAAEGILEYYTGYGHRYLERHWGLDKLTFGLSTNLMWCTPCVRYQGTIVQNQAVHGSQTLRSLCTM